MPTLRRLVDMTGPDFYPTPHWATRALLSVEKFEGSICEPFCGEDDIALVIRAAGYNWVLSYDLYDYGVQATICDYKELKGPFDNIVTNPPFKLATEAIEHFMPITTTKICMLLRLAFLESVSRYEKFYKSRKLARVWVFTERLSLYPKGQKGEGGTVAYGWFVFDRYRTNYDPAILFLPPGFKDE